MDNRFTIKIKRGNVPAWRTLQGLTGESNADEVIRRAGQLIRDRIRTSRKVPDPHAGSSNLPSAPTERVNYSQLLDKPW